LFHIIDKKIKSWSGIEWIGSICVLGMPDAIVAELQPDCQSNVHFVPYYSLFIRAGLSRNCSCTELNRALTGINDTTSLELAKKKLGSAKQAKADLICTACPYCHLQFERTRKILPFESVSDFDLPSVTYVQLIGMALGLDEKQLGITNYGLRMNNPPALPLTHGP